MHELLLPRAPAGSDLADAAQVAGRWLSARWRGWPWLARSLPRDVREELAVACAWQVLLRELGAAGETGRADLAAAVAEIERLGTGEPRALLGQALEVLLRRHRLPPLFLLRPLRALERDAHVHAWQTRAELAAHAAELTQAGARLLVHVLGLPSERDRLLGEALGRGLQLAAWIVGLREDLARGRLHLPMEDLARHRVELADLRAARASPSLRSLLGDEVAWARGFLAKGWPLCQELGPWRGRQLALFLRWHAASLSALERRGFDALAGAPPSGKARLVACLAASLARRGAPFPAPPP